MVPAPSRRVVELLKAAVEAHISAYIRTGGGRHFPTEDAQDDARTWLASIEERAT